MPVLKKALIRAYSAGTHKADVQVVGSLATHLTGVPVATDIPASEVQAGRECSLVFFGDGINPDDAVVVTVHGAVPGGGAGGIPSRIEDADTDTVVNTEQAANENKVRIKAGGTERGVFQTVSPHVKLTGEAQLDGWMGLNIAPQTNVDVLRVGNPAGTYTANLTLLRAQPGANPTLGANNIAFTGIGGVPAPIVASGITGLTIEGLNFTLGLAGGGGGAGITVAAALTCAWSATGLTGALTLTDGYGIRVQSPLVFGANLTATQSYGIRIQNQGHGRITNTTALKIDDTTGSTGTKLLIEAGPATPNLRLEAGAPTNPGANLGRSALLLAFNENGTVTLRRVEWKLQSGLVAGDKVLVAV